MNNNVNPFEFFGSFMNQDGFKSAKWMAGMGMPNIDFGAMTNMVTEGADVISSTSQLVFDSLQSIAKRGTDSFQKNTSEMFSTMKKAVSAGDAEQIANCGQNYLKWAVENAISNTKEVLDITSKSSGEMLNMIGKTFANNLNKSFTKGKD